MGGYGSGNYKSNKKLTTSSYYEIDVKNMENLELMWQIFGKLPLCINHGGIKKVRSSVRYMADFSNIEYLWVKLEKLISNSDYIVEMTYTVPNYGGNRWWFLCPYNGCRKRVEILYLAKSQLACRKCLNLAYASQSEEMYSRMDSQSNKISQKLEWDEDGYSVKPKHMHWKTYNKLVAKRQIYEMNYYRSIVRQFKLDIEI